MNDQKTNIVSAEDIAKQLTWRYATKIFNKDKKVSESILNSIIEAGRMAPTAYGLQPFRIVKVENVELREKIKAEAGFGQTQITDASDFFVLTRRTDLDDAFVDEYISRVAEVKGLKVEDLKGFSDMMKGDILARSDAEKATWAGRQAYIALGMILETAALLEVDVCPMEGFMPAKVDEILGLQNEHLASLALIAIGYRGEGDVYANAPKVRVVKEKMVIVK